MKREDEITEQLAQILSDAADRIVALDTEISLMYAATHSRGAQTVGGRHLLGPAETVALLSTLFRMLVEMPEIGRAGLQDLIRAAFLQAVPQSPRKGSGESQPTILEKWESARMTMQDAAEAVQRIDADFAAVGAVDSDALEKSMCVSTSGDPAALFHMATCIIDEARVQNNFSLEELDRMLDLMRQSLHFNAETERELKGLPLS